MDTALKTNSTERLALIWCGSAGKELTEEYVVPDSMPDVGEILDARGVLTVQGKDTEAGSVHLNASLSVSVVYAPEDCGGIRSLELTLPADIRLDAPEADTDCRTVARLRVRSVEARLLNSRKIAVRAEAEAEVCCYRSETLSLSAGMEDEGCGAHIRMETAQAMLVTDVREKTFAVTDEYPWPSGCGGADKILSRQVDVVTEDVKFVGGKVLFRGRVRSELLLADPASEKTFFGRYETEFSQIMEVDAQQEDTQPELTIFFTGVYFDLPEPGSDGDRLRAEIHMGAQCVCRERRELPYMADLYSSRTELIPRCENVRLVRDVRAVVMRQTVANRIEGAEREAELLQTGASVGGIMVEDGAVKTAVNVRLMYILPDGGCSSVRGRLPAEFTLPELPAGAALRNVSVAVTDIYCVPGTGDVRVTLRLDALAVEETEISCVCAVEEDADAWSARGRMPSAVLLRIPAGTDLWTVARRYRSSVEDILLVNEGRRDGLLLIPKGR